VSSDQILNEETIDFTPGKGPVSSATFSLRTVEEISIGEAVSDESPVQETEAATLSPVFKELATPVLAPLPKENRARLQMQSPNRLFFYWSIKHNAFHTLTKAIGNHTGSYTLVIKLIDLGREIEALYPSDAEGSWWFDAEADSDYRAEVGFYAPNRPFIRILFSNTVHTPRKSPSPRSAETAEWSVSAGRFARVLNAAGFTEDAFDVALAGDEPKAAEATARRAFARFVGTDSQSVNGWTASEIRNALLLIASGTTLEALRWQISPSLFAFLQANFEPLGGQRATQILQDEYGIEADEFEIEESYSAVHGSSLISFPRTLRKRLGPRPVSSFTMGQ
jgi:hypothetical protein